MRLFQIYADDLQKLEYALPAIADRCTSLMNDPQLQVLFQEVKDILSNVRWNYGPPSEVHRIDVE